jgi:ubiquinone biosynthesis protein
MQTSSRQFVFEDFEQVLSSFISGGATVTERISAVTAALRSGVGPQLRELMGQWALRIMPVEALVPDAYVQWRPLVQEALRFILLRLSDARLAPKLIEQMDLPSSTPAEVRLLRFIAKAPGLQKLGQVLARNRHMQPSLRRALSELENSISDVNAVDIRAIIVEQLGGRLQTCAVEIEPDILSEASVSAVMRFTWWNPESRERERGVFKVLKPHVPAYFAEDLDLLQQLGIHLESKRYEYGFGAHVLYDTFSEVRRLLQHEVDFSREQATLLRAFDLYRSVAGARTPRLIAQLCGSHITAMTEESGVKVTDAVARMPACRRHLIADQLIETLIAVPLFASDNNAMFHADPHAGNLLYDERKGEVVILDWALTEQLTYNQRRHLALVFIMIALRDVTGVCNAIQALSEVGFGGDDRRERIVRDRVTQFIDQLPFTRLPEAIDAIRLVDLIALEGVPFSAPLLMFRKVLFTLDGIVHEIAGPSTSIEFTLTRYVMQRWMANWVTFGSPLFPTDWLAVQSSMLLYGSRLWSQWARVLSSSLYSGAYAPGAAPDQTATTDEVG